MSKQRELSLILKCLLPLLGSFWLAGCVPAPTFSPAPVCGKEAFQGLFVLNEGLLGANTASLDVWDETSLVRCEDITRARLGGPLGDVAHSVYRDADTLFLVVNNSRQVQKWLLPEMKLLGTLQVAAPFSPRHMVRTGPHKAYLTSLYGNGELLVFDPVQMTLTGTFPVARFQEGIVCAGETAFVAVDAFTGRSASRIARIHIPTDSVLGFTDLPVLNPSRVVAFKGRIWVSCIGDYNPAGEGSAVVEIDPATGQVVRSFAFSGSVFGLEPAGDQLLVLRDSAVAKLDPASGEIQPEWRTRRALTETGTDILYGMSWDPVTSLLYVCNARDYVTQGEVIVLNPLGEVLRRMPAGYLPKLVFPVR